MHHSVTGTGFECDAHLTRRRAEANLGTWGYALFSDDIALDVRDFYRTLIEEQPDIGDREATLEILQRFGESLDDPVDVSVIWLALAASQSRLGRLDPAVADRAIQAIDTDEGMSEWMDRGPKAVARRREALAKVRAQLTGPQPKRRNVPVPRSTSLQPGDALVYHYGDHYLVLRVAKIYRGQPVCVLLDFAGKEIPAIQDIAMLPDYLWIDRWSPQGRPVPFTMQVRNRVDYADAGYSLIGNIGARSGDEKLDTTRVEDWQTGLIGSTVVRRLLER
jgi:hypothetical protein